jgi:uncharacterized protein with von Willebrand factor type A (vWA) domain
VVILQENQSCRKVKKLARENSEAALQAVIDIVVNPRSKPSDKIRAAELILDRAWGKPAQSLELTSRSEENPLLEIVRSDPELTEIAENLFRLAMKRAASGLEIRNVEPEKPVE